MKSFMFNLLMVILIIFVPTAAEAGGPYPLPFPAGETWWASQDWYSEPSHQNEAAWDFNFSGGDLGKPVIAVCNGPVTYAGYTNSGYGRVVTVDCGGEQMRVAHLNSIAVITGQIVALGQYIGDVGGSGCKTGLGCSDTRWPPHAHYNFLVPGAGPTSQNTVEVDLIYIDSSGVERIGHPESCDCVYDLGWNRYTSTNGGISTPARDSIGAKQNDLWARNFIEYNSAHSPDIDWRLHEPGNLNDFLFRDWDGGTWGEITLAYNPDFDATYVLRHGIKYVYNTCQPLGDCHGENVLGIPLGDELDLTRLSEYMPDDSYCNTSSWSDINSCIEEYCGRGWPTFTSMQRFDYATICWHYDLGGCFAPSPRAYTGYSLPRCSTVPDWRFSYLIRTSSGVEDHDGDAYFAPEDCDDFMVDVNPEAEEVCGNGVDEDCDGEDEVCPVCHDVTRYYDASALFINGTTNASTWYDRVNGSGVEFRVWGPVISSIASNNPTLAWNAGDVTGDGWDDVVQVTTSTSNAKTYAQVYRATGNGGFYAVEPWLLGTPSNGTSGVAVHAFVGHVGTDNRTDLILGFRDPTNNWIMWKKCVSEGNQFRACVDWGYLGIYGDVFLMGDYNDDGQVELLRGGKNVCAGSLIWMRMDSSSVREYVRINGSASYCWGSPTAAYLVANARLGDGGRDDVVQLYADGANYSLKYGQYTDPLNLNTGQSATGLATAGSRHYIVDMDGDSKPDLVTWRDTTLYIMPHNGSTTGETYQDSSRRAFNYNGVPDRSTAGQSVLFGKFGRVPITTCEY